MSVMTKESEANGKYAARIRRARELVGSRPVNRLKWLLDFAQQFETETEIGAHVEDVHAEIREFTARSLPRATIVFPPDAAGVIALRKATHTTISQWVKEGEVSLVSGEHGQFVHVISKARGPRGPVSYYHGAARAALLEACARLLEAEGGRVARCARSGCGRLFVKVKRGAYCSKRCSQSMRTSRFRSSHSKEELSEARHRAYKAKVRKQRGPATAGKVSRRSRPE
jgi:hypothetical protein